MTKTILIVEDNELNMKLFNDLLQARGFNILQSVDGMDTLQLAREHRPDLIVMDIRLPQVSGTEHIKMLKADDDLKDIPVLAVTAFAMKGDESEIMESGCDGYIAKPISISHFLDEIKRFLTMAHLRLTDSLKIGHAEVDAEHQRLVILLNEFVDLLEAGDDKGCSGKINEMTQALKSHLEHEEKIMERLGYKHLEEHKKEHIEAVRKYDALIKDTERNGFGGSFANELISILLEDLIKADMDFKAFLQEIDFRE